MKRIKLAALTALIVSANVMAFGGGGGSLGGSVVVNDELKKQHWNGLPGRQVAAINGVRIHWFADACGKPNGNQFDAKMCDPQMDMTEGRTADASEATGVIY